MTLNPTPADIGTAREYMGLTQAEAAALVHLGAAKRWSEYERGAQAIDPARWELFLVKCGLHPDYKPAKRVAFGPGRKKAQEGP